MTHSGAVKCWGFNGFGQILTLPPSGVFLQVSAGVWHSCGVTQSGVVKCWGLNDNGQSSPPSGTFLPVSAGGNSTTFTGGDGHSCGVTQSGAVKCWGRNMKGELGLGTDEEAAHPDPAKINNNVIGYYGWQATGGDRFSFRVRAATSSEGGPWTLPAATDATR